MKVDVTSRAVVTKSLTNLIQSFVIDGFENVHIPWADPYFRTQFCEVLEDMLGELYDQGKVITGKVICDERNNTSSDFADGKFNLDLHFREKNAVVTTKLHFKVDVTG